MTVGAMWEVKSSNVEEEPGQALTVRDYTGQEKSQVALVKDAAVHYKVFGHWLQLHLPLASISFSEEMAQGKMEASA